MTDEVSRPQEELSYSPLFIYEPIFHSLQVASVTKKRACVTQSSCIHHGLILCDGSDQSVKLELGFIDAAVLMNVLLVMFYSCRKKNIKYLHIRVI